MSLEEEGLHHAATSRLEEPAERVVLPAWLLIRADHAGVRAPAQLQVLALEPELAHDASRGGPGRHDHTLPGVAPRRSQSGQGIEM